MYLRTLGSLILVAGTSYHLASASWQVVLLSFLVAGMAFAIWRIRKAIARRTKIKALWRRSRQLDALLARVDDPTFESCYLKEERQYRSSRSAKIVDGDGVEQVMVSSVTATRARVIPLKTANATVDHQDESRLHEAAGVTVEGSVESVEISGREINPSEVAQSTDSAASGSSSAPDQCQVTTMSGGGRVYKFRISDLSRIKGRDDLNNMALI